MTPSAWRQGACHVVFIVVPVVVSVVLKATVKPTTRGFFCDDESIRYPYSSDSVRWWLACFVATIVGVVVVVAASLRRFKRAPGAPLASNWRQFAAPLYSPLVTFVAGGLYLNAIVEIGKYSTGRLRPHFVEICQPLIYNSTDHLLGDCPALSASLSRLYVAPPDESRSVGGLYFVCGGESESKILKGRLSFPSGHSAVIFYGTLYAAMHMQVHLKGFGVLTSFFQLAFLLTGGVVSLTRVSDHAHHPGDVAAGAALGVIAAIFAHRNPLTLDAGEEDVGNATTGRSAAESNKKSAGLGRDNDGATTDDAATIA